MPLEHRYLWRSRQRSVVVEGRPIYRIVGCLFSAFRCYPVSLLGLGMASKSLRRAPLADDAGQLSLSTPLVIVAVVIGAVVGMAILAALMPTYLDSLSGVTGEFNDPNTTTGDDDADALLPVFGLLVAFAGLFAIVGLVLLVVKIRRGGS